MVVGKRGRVGPMVWCLTCLLVGCIDKSSALQLFHEHDVATADLDAHDAAPVCAVTCDDGNPCTDDSCAMASPCTHTDNTAACNDDDACTHDDHCSAGICLGGDSVVCGASDACHDAGTCDAGSGKCSNPWKADGTLCDDGQVCTGPDACKSGVCSGSRGLISTWRGDGNANDSAGPYYGTLVGAATFEAGIAAQAFSFPGTGGVNFSSNAGNFGTTAWTVELWVRTMATSEQSLLSKRAVCDGAESGPGWDMRISNGKIQLEVDTGTKSGSVGSPGAVINDGTWHHVAFVRNGAALSLYQDGVLLNATSDLDSALNDSTTKNLLLGNGTCIADGSSAFDGALDEVSLYHRALTASEVAAQANGQCLGVDNACQAGACVRKVLGSLQFKPTTVTPAPGQGTTIGLHLVAKDAFGNVMTGSYPSAVTLTVSTPSAQVATLTSSGTYLQNPGNPATMENPDGVSFDATAGITYVLATNTCQVFAASSSIGLQWIGGTGGTGFVDTANPKTSSFYYPAAITMDIAGGTTSLYIMDKNNGVIRKMDSSGVTTFAGTPCVLCGHGSFDAIGTSASFNDSVGIGIDLNHDLLVADTGNGRIRRVSTVDASVTTLTTSGTFVANPGNPRLFTQPMSVTGGAGGKIYIGTGSSDGGGKVFVVAGAQITMLASGFGTGGAMSVAVGADGTVYFSDQGSQVVRAIAPDAVHTLSVVAGLVGQSGTTDGNSQQARFSMPAGLTMDPLGSLYLGEGKGQVRRISTAASLALSSASVGDSVSADAVTVAYAGTGLVPRQVCASASGFASVCITITPAF
jgi:hypothetical protein